MGRPNLFNYATSELSQDAFICWLLEWANPQHREADRELNQCALKFVDALFDKGNKKVPSQIDRVEIQQQHKNIDVMCIVNKRYAILIEDKVATVNHSNQLVRYLKDLAEEYPREKIIPIYLKTIEQGDYSDVKEKEFGVFLRKDFLNVLESYRGQNPILLDYRGYLQDISREVEAYLTKPIDDWGYYQWMGFYLRLQDELRPTGNSSWDYVPNPSGGFMGFWWHVQQDNSVACGQYLQLEEGKLCFKIWVTNRSERAVLRQKWHEIIIRCGRKHGLGLDKPARFGNGEYMTVCQLKGDYRAADEKSVIDMEETIQILKRAETVLDEARKMNS